MQPNTYWIAHDPCIVKEGQNSCGIGIAFHMNFIVVFVQDNVRQLAKYKRVLWEKLYVIVSCIHVEYTIEDSGILRKKLSPGNYLCCGLIDSSLLHVIGDCVLIFAIDL